MSPDESNEALNGRGSGEELPAELKAVEAELASLRPRDDRLDRERLVFLAGQASALGRQQARRTATACYRQARPAIRPWAWPAAFAGMTAVAASLLIALVLRSGPTRVVERVRIVRVPVAAHVEEGTPSAEDAGEDAHRSAAPGRRAFSPRPAARDWAPRGNGPLSEPDWSRFGSRAEYLEMIDRMLARGVDPWRQPPALPRHGEKGPDAPAPYREWLNTMLDDQARAEPPGDWPTSPSHSGANS
jgi:hypothetical protein